MLGEMLTAFSIFLIMDLCCKAEQPMRINLEHDTSKKGINQSERAEFLFWHNFYRRQVDSPTAANMVYLLYHRELELAALKWATECNFNHGNFNFKREQLEPLFGIGQNIGVRFGGYNIEGSVFSWFNERMDYTYENASCAPGAKCGHYFQVASAGVRYIGCAIVYCPQYSGSRIVRNDAYNTVCDYYPSGVTVRYTQEGNAETMKIYEAGEPCTSCPEGYKVCEEKLCHDMQEANSVATFAPALMTTMLTTKVFHLTVLYFSVEACK